MLKPPGMSSSDVVSFVKRRIPKGTRTETRNIMQQAHFVIPDKKAAAEGLKRIEEIRKDLLTGNYLVDADYVLAKSIVTVAEIILREVTQ